MTTTATQTTTLPLDIIVGSENVLRRTTDLRDHPFDLKSPKQKTTRHCDDFKVGDRLGHLMADHLGCSLHTGRSIITFTTICVMGRDAHNDNGSALRSGQKSPKWGQQRWVHTKSRTHRFLPAGPRWQRRGRSEWAWSDCFDGANLLLEAFNLSLEDVLNHYGNVDDYERKIFDLASIIRALRPELLS